MKKNQIYYIFLFLFFVASVFSITVLPDTYHQYKIDGSIIRTQGDLKDFTITVLGKLKDSTNLIPLNKYGADYLDNQDSPIALTDKNGNFNLVFSCKYGELEAYALKVVMPLGESYVTNLYYTKDYNRQEILQRFTYSNESGCSCESTTSTEMVVSGYVYNNNIGAVQIPY